MTPHELSHQWFYGFIGSNHALEPWLDEALATYAELLYYERYHPESVDWW
jgi:aminopeptidase N